MCYKEGVLQSYLDGELPSFQANEIRNHLEACPACRAELIRLQETGDFVNQKLKAGAVEISLSTGAVKEKMKQKGAAGVFSKYRKQFAACFIIAAFAAAFSFSSVRVLAGNLLNIFRVERIQTINISSQDFAQLDKAIRTGAGQVDINNLGKFEVTGKQETIASISLNKAQEAVDFPIRLPGNPPDGIKPSLSLNTGAKLCITPDTDQVNQLLKELGSTKLMPEGLDGRKFEIDIPTIVTAQYSAENYKLMISQGRSPELRAPEGVDVEAIREALLAIPVLPESLRSQLEAIKDWQHTVPVPNIEGTATEVTINGNSGVFIKPSDTLGNGESKDSALIWKDGGIIYCIAGDRLELNQAVILAEQMR
ncbi:MAG: Putative transmembrane anti-sigma factor [Desulfotomaculum sp. 46_296]|nr:MAG: Putative transmembrane anti-sigma factor [Desulfotomaculum sp. 46_296]HAU32067.1 hypothetical protein [Desulfotomaculum sp.]